MEQDIHGSEPPRTLAQIATEFHVNQILVLRALSERFGLSVEETEKFIQQQDIGPSFLTMAGLFGTLPQTEE